MSSTGSAFGTDSVGGTTAFSLAVSAAGVDSGLDTTDGTSIFLFKEGDLVVGRIGGAGGAAAFAVAINSTSGVVSVAQYASLKHPDATNPDESVSITDERAAGGGDGHRRRRRHGDELDRHRRRRAVPGRRADGGDRPGRADGGA